MAQTLSFSPAFSPTFESELRTARPRASFFSRDRKAAGRAKATDKSNALTREDQALVAALHQAQSDVDHLHNCFDNAVDETLMDAITYELKAATLKYKYYLNLCREKGITCGQLPANA